MQRPHSGPTIVAAALAPWEHENLVVVVDGLGIPTRRGSIASKTACAGPTSRLIGMRPRRWATRW